MKKNFSVGGGKVLTTDRWVGKIALVTGAGSGIGAATAEGLAKAGIKVVALDIHLDKVENLRKNLNVKGEIIPVKCDLQKIDEIVSVFKLINEKYGAVHILVNAAGFARSGFIIETDFQHFKDVIDVNVMAVIACTQQALQLMKATGVDDGHIFFINSILGHAVSNMAPGWFNVYSTSKFAITAFVETLRQELAFLKSKIKVSSISPGGVKTNFFTNYAHGSGKNPEDFDTSSFRDNPSMEPKNIADAILYNLSTPPNVQLHEMIIMPIGESGHNDLY